MDDMDDNHRIVIIGYEWDNGIIIMDNHGIITINEWITSSTAQGGGGSFKNRKPIGEIGCCESRMAERIH